MLLPLLEVGLFEGLLSVSIELVELVFEELSHDSEAGPVEEEVELLVVLFLVGFGKLDLGLLGPWLLLG